MRRAGKTTENTEDSRVKREKIYTEGPPLYLLLSCLFSVLSVSSVVHSLS